MKLKNEIEKESVVMDIKEINEIVEQLIKGNQYSKEGIRVIRPQLIELLEDIDNGKFLNDYNVTNDQIIELKNNFQVVIKEMNEFEKNNFKED